MSMGAVQSFHFRLGCTQRLRGVIASSKTTYLDEVTDQTSHLVTAAFRASARSPRRRAVLHLSERRGHKEGFATVLLALAMADTR